MLPRLGSRIDPPILGVGIFRRENPTDADDQLFVLRKSPDILGRFGIVPLANTQLPFRSNQLFEQMRPLDGRHQRQTVLNSQPTILPPRLLKLAENPIEAEFRLFELTDDTGTMHGWNFPQSSRIRKNSDACPSGHEFRDM